jgi:hypothetical protein
MMGVRTDHACLESSLAGLRLDCTIRQIRPLDIPETDNIKALRLDWELTEAAMGRAWERFRKHQNKSRYQAEVREIMEIMP